MISFLPLSLNDVPDGIGHRAKSFKTDSAKMKIHSASFREI